MNSIEEKTADSAEKTKAEINGSGTCFHDGRTRFYGILLLFIVVVSLLLVSIPTLRNRLTTRTAELRRAIYGEGRSAVAEIAPEDSADFEKFGNTPKSALSLGQIPLEEYEFPERMNVADMKNASSTALMNPRVAEPDTGTRPAVSGDVSDIAKSREGDTDFGVRYSHGELEKNAYDLLLQSSPKVKDMVDGVDSSLKFRSWGAVKRKDGLFWVRLVFVTDEGLEVEYIWQVDLQSKQVSPLSYNARSLS